MDDWSCLTLVGLYFDCKNKGSVLQRGVKTWCGLLTSNLARETKENQWHFWFLLDGLMSRCPRARPVSGFIRAKNLQLLGRVTDMERLRAYSNVNPFEVADLLVGSALFVEPIMQNVAIKWILAITPSINKFLVISSSMLRTELGLNQDIGMSCTCRIFHRTVQGHASGCRKRVLS